MGIKIYTITEEKRHIPIFGRKRSVLSFFDVSVDEKERYRVVMHGAQVTYMRGRDTQRDQSFVQAHIGDKIAQPVYETDEKNWLGVVTCEGAGQRVDTPRGPGLLLKGNSSSLLWWCCNCWVSPLPIFSVSSQGKGTAHFMLANADVVCLNKNEFFQGQTREWMQANNLWHDYSDEIRIHDKLVYQGQQKSTRERDFGNY